MIQLYSGHPPGTRRRVAARQWRDAKRAVLAALASMRRYREAQQALLDWHREQR